MKKAVLVVTLCVLFSCLIMCVGTAFCSVDERLIFTYQNKIFTYSLVHNIKKSSQFDLNYELNKFNRFGSFDERKTLLLRMDQANIDKSVSLNYLFPNLKKTIKEIEKVVFVKPKNASLKINSNTEKVFNISNEIVGVKLNIAELYKQIFDAYISGKKLNFTVPTIKTQPKITRQNYAAFTHLRADFSTNIASSSPDRKHNVKTALASLNKVSFMPNQVFSFNDTVGRRTQENGYREAKIIVNNEYIEGLGGGVCQVSTTLYNAALKAGLSIVEANKHSKQVSYVKYGFDAMVNFGSSDLKIKNNTSEKITIITNYSPTEARIRIFGEDLAGVSYKLRNEIVDVIEPGQDIKVDTAGEYADKVWFEDECFTLKHACKGMEVKSYRDKYVNNQLLSSELLRFDKFKAQNEIIVYGAKKRQTNIIGIGSLA